jgi:hypothetical protein
LTFCTCPLKVDKEEISYVVRELWRGRSARNQDSSNVGRGMWRSVNQLTITRWDHSRPPSIDNLVLLTFDEAEEHEATTLEEIAAKEPEFFALVTTVLHRAATEFKF